MLGRLGFKYRKSILKRIQILPNLITALLKCNWIILILPAFLAGDNIFCLRLYVCLSIRLWPTYLKNRWTYLNFISQKWFLVQLKNWINFVQDLIQNGWLTIMSVQITFWAISLYWIGILTCNCFIGRMCLAPQQSLTISWWCWHQCYYR